MNLQAFDPVYRYESLLVRKLRRTTNLKSGVPSKLERYSLRDQIQLHRKLKYNKTRKEQEHIIDTFESQTSIGRTIGRWVSRVLPYALILTSLGYAALSSRHSTVPEPVETHAQAPSDTIVHTQPEQELVIPECRLTLKQVQSGSVAPEVYVKERETCSPAVVRARQSGVLKGLVYDPSDRDLEELLRDYFFEHASEEEIRNASEEDVRAIVQAGMQSYQNVKALKRAGTVLPTSIRVFGQGYPHYIVFTEWLVSSLGIQNESDVDDIIGHELVHVYDWSKGITLGNVRLARETITLDTFRLDFLVLVMELRAEYRSLSNFYAETLQRGDFSVSKKFFGVVANDYAERFQQLQTYGATEMENNARIALIDEVKGVLPEIRGNQLLMHFNLYGTNRTATISRSP